jgi:hypothetical protein
MKSSFVVLIGSQARGDADSRSDVDVLVVGEPHERELDALAGEFRAPINIVTFSNSDFNRLTRAGSLFIGHCFSEGRLLSGSIEAWARRAQCFSVKSSFSDEVKKCTIVCRFLSSNTAMYGGHYLAPLVTAYSQIKNASIFCLAHHRIYLFNKDAAILEAASLVKYEEGETLKDLRNFYDYSVRNQDPSLPFALDNIEHGERALEQVTRFAQRIEYACC